jgi:predicted HAD superfamily Cof-like phosphohydrolase
MQSRIIQAAEFRRCFECSDELTARNVQMQIELINEEASEVKEAFWNYAASHFDTAGNYSEGPKLDRADLLKELADLKYVIDQLCCLLGWDIDEAQDLVHQNNLSKLGPDGKVIRREDGKVLKPEGYKKVDLSHLVE